MKANPDKYHFLLKGGNEQTTYINEVAIYSSKEEKLLGVTIDNKLNFHTPTKNNIYTRIAKPISKTNNHESFHNIPIGYCPVVWMFHSKQINNCINRLHEQPLGINYLCTFQDLLILYISVASFVYRQR